MWDRLVVLIMMGFNVFMVRVAMLLELLCPYVLQVGGLDHDEA